MPETSVWTGIAIASVTGSQNVLLSNNKIDGSAVAGVEDGGLRRLEHGPGLRDDRGRRG